MSVVPTVDIAELLPRLDTGDPVFLLDVRNDEEFAAWPLETRRPVETLHIPYFDFIEDAEGAIARIPEDRDVVVLCAQGGSSAMVVEMLQAAGISARNVNGGMVAYGDYLQPVKVRLRPEEGARFEIWQLNRRGKGCLSYVIRSQGEAVVVDASRDVERYEGFVAALGARIVWVLDTHVHADHVSGGPALAARTQAPYFVDAGPGFDSRHRVASLSDGAEIHLGGDGGASLALRLMGTPGHTPGSTSYLLGGRYLLTGDTIFVAGIGRPDLGGHVVEWGQALFRTLGRLLTLPDDTVLLPAHYSSASEIGPDGVVAGRLGDLRRNVPELRIETEEAFVEAMKAALKTPPEHYGEIIRTNLGLVSPDAERVSLWEHGKNECAIAARGATAR